MGLTKPRAAQIFNLDYKQATRVVTTVSVSLTGGAPSSVDGVSLSVGDRVLVTAQSTASQNGLYYVVTVGSGVTGTWARTSDGNDNGEIEAGMIVMVTEGVIYADTQWKLITDDPITIGTTALTFTQNYSANSITGGTSNVRVFSNANVTISSAGTANVLTVSSTGTVVTGTESVTGNITGGNVLTGGLISATGNATVGNITATIATLTTFTSAQGGNVTGTLVATSSNAQFFNQTNGAGYVTVAGYLSATGNVTGGNLLTGGLISSTGTITGANITGGNILTAGIMSSTGNATHGNILTGGVVSATGAINSDANIVAGTNTKASPAILFTNSANTQYGALIMQKVGVERWLIGSDNSTGNGNVVIRFNATSNYLTVTEAGAVIVGGNVTGGNLLTGGLISATGNITGNYFLGNVACASGIYASRIFNGTSEANIGTSGGNANISIGGVSNVVVFATTGEYVTGLLSVTGNITGGNVSATNHTGTNVSVTGTVTAASTVGGVITGSSASISGTVTAASTVGGVITGSSASVTGTITAASTVGGVITGSSASASGNVTGGNINTAGNISATGNIAGNYLLANIYYATGFSASRIFNGTSEANIGTAGGNANISVGGVSNVFVVSSTGIYTTGLSSVTGNITGGNVSTGGLISATGNINTAGTVNINSTAGNYNVLNISGTALAPYGTPQTWKFFTNNTALGGNPSFILFPDSSTQTTAYPGTSSTLSLTGNVTGGNILTGGLISATGTVTGSSLIGSVVTATGNITGGNVLTGGLISATGNITGGNILTVGLVSATGNVTGNYLLGNGRQLTGINAFSNIAVANGNSIVANSISSTLTLSAGSGITLVATPGTGVITIATSSGGTSIFATGGDMGTVTETVTASEDLGLVTDAVTTSYDLGSVVSASGLVYPSQLILPAYTPATLPSAAPAAQFVYLSTSSIGAMTAFSDGTNWRFTSSGNIVS